MNISKYIHSIKSILSILSITSILSIALLLTSCSEEASSPQPSPFANTPISFSVSPSSTRAYAGSINDITALASAGFGVYAYYTADADYTPSLFPDLFFNQSVTWQTAGDSISHWTYNPTKYWPNEKGHKATFFAYAPYETINAATANPSSDKYHTTDTTGIVALSSNSNKGDPIVEYKVATDSAQASVDLMWGTGSLVNLSRNDTTQTVSFRFRHALARLGVTVSIPGIVAPIDSTNGTIVLIDSIVIKGNFPVRGELNLNNTSASSPLWSNLNYSQGDSSTLIIDSRSITRSLRNVDYNKVKGTELWRHNLQMGGVNQVSRYLLKAFRGEDEASGATNRAYFMLIPDGRETVINISVTYTIHKLSTTSSASTTQDSTTTKTIHSRETLGTLRAGQTYNIHLELPSL